MSRLALSDSDLDRIADLVAKRLQQREEATKASPVATTKATPKPDSIAAKNAAQEQKAALLIAERWYAAFGSEKVTVKRLYHGITLPNEFMASSFEESGRINALGQFISRNWKP